MAEKVLMKGNEAFAEAVIRGGCRFYYGYPITPQSEIPEYMSRELPKRGGTFLQAESELAAVNAAYGTASAGGSVFLSSSSPGIALMQEGFSFLASADVPAVILNVSRCGPGIGGIQPGQADYYQMTRGGGNGDYHIPVFAPDCIQEAVDMLYDAPKIADDYRTPVMVLADGMMGQMMEPVLLPEERHALTPDEVADAKPWALTGFGAKKDGKRAVVKSLRLQPDELEQHVEDLFEKYEEIKKKFTKYEATGLEDAEIVFVAFGTVARLTREAIELLAENGIKAGLIRPISLWPFPYEAFDHLSSKTKVVISTELSMGQMIDDVKMGVNGKVPVRLVNRTGGIVPTSLEIMEKAMKILEELK